MSWRRQLPVHSPVPGRALVAGTRAMVRGDGESAERLSRRIGEHWGARDVLLTDSGTTALMLAIVAAAVSEDAGPVALPAYGCYDLATAAIGAEAAVVFYDVDPGSLGPDLGSLDRALANGARVVVVAHLYGVPVDVQPVVEVARRAGAVVIDDAAQAFGALAAGRPAGAHGSLGLVSFGRGKGLSGGGGGALFANDEIGERLLARARAALDDRRPDAGTGPLLRNAAQWLLGRPSVYALPASIPWLRLGETLYRQPKPPGRLARSSCAMVLAGWPDALAVVERRRAHAARLRAAAHGGSWLPVSPPATAQPSYLRLPVRRVRPDVPAEGAAARLGVGRAYPVTLADLAPLRPFVRGTHAQCSGAAQLSRDLFTFPTHALLTPDDLLALERCLAR